MPPGESQRGRIESGAILPGMIIVIGVVLEPVEPVGHRESGCFVSRRDDAAPEGIRCGYETMRFPVYPASPEGEALRELRVSLVVGIGECARALGISVAELSGLETGRFRPVAGWEPVRELVREAAKASGTRTVPGSGGSK